MGLYITIVDVSVYNACIGENIHEIDRPPYLIPVEYSQSIGNCLNKQKIFTRSLFSCRFNEGEIALISSQRSLLFTFFAKKMFIEALLNLNVILIRGGFLFIPSTSCGCFGGFFLGGGVIFGLWYVEASPRCLPYWSVANCQLLSFRECLNEYICMYTQKKNKEEGINSLQRCTNLASGILMKREVWSEINLKYFNYRLCKK